MKIVIAAVKKVKEWNGGDADIPEKHAIEVAKKISKASGVDLKAGDFVAWCSPGVGSNGAYKKFDKAVRLIFKPYKGLYDELDDVARLLSFVEYICGFGKAEVGGIRFDFKVGKELKKKLSAIK